MPETDIFLEDVTANISRGTLLKSSQATYRLRVHCAKLELLADILGICMKTVEMQVDVEYRVSGFA